MWHSYITPATLESALAALAEHREKARIIAGGTDILLEMENGGRAGVEVLIDITRIPGLDDIYEGEDGLLHIGPAVTHNHVVASSLLVEKAFPLVQACWSESAPQIRNRGTVAGNVITASPANDAISPLMAMGASIVLISTTGRRVVPLKDFYQGVRKTMMAPDEMLIDIQFAPLLAEQRGTFVKLGLRKAQAISVLNLCAIISFDGRQVKEASLSLGSVAPTIVICPEASDFLRGKLLDNDTINTAADLVAKSASPITDLRGTAEYRADMVKVLAKRALEKLAEGTERDAFPSSPILLWGTSSAHIEKPLPTDFVHGDSEVIETTVNGKKYTIEGANHKTLLDALRDHLGLMGTKEGCGEGECGACTIHLDGVAVMACLVPAPRAHHAEIITIEGVGTDAALHPLQEAFITEGAVQCGYCTPGFIMSGVKLLEEKPVPTPDEIRQALTGNLCRCTGYYKIIQAFEKAVQPDGDK